MAAEPILITAPAVEPITLAEARLHLRLASDYTSEDDTITALIKAARRMAEQQLGRKLITQSWDMVLDAFPSGDEAIQLHPLLVKAQSITQIIYLDTAGATQTFAGASYTLDPHMLPGYVFLNEGYSWPGDVADSANAVKVRVVCGYGDAASDVPPEVVAWIKVQLATLWRNREAFQAGVSVSELPGRYVDRLLDGERVYLGV